MAEATAALLPARPAVLAATPLVRETALALTQSSDRTVEARDSLRSVITDDLTTAPEQSLHLPEPNDERLRAVTHLVEFDMVSLATLERLGRRVRVRERTLSRLFQHETGMRFRQWRTQLRIHRALLMLTDGAQ